MEKFKKLLSMLLAVALTASVVFTGTMAYLTQDAGSENNVFTVGNIDVSLDEEVGIVGEGGEVKSDESGAEYTAVMPGDYLKKKVTVSNDGKTDAYVAITVTMNNADKINEAIDVFYGDDKAQAMYDFIFDGWGLNHGKDLDGDGTNDAGMRLTITGDDMPENVLHVDSVKTIDEYALFYTRNWYGEQSDIIPFDGYYTTGMNEYEFKYIYYAFLPAGESTTIFNGLNVPAEFTNAQMAMFDGLKIDVSAKAIQADNMGIAEKYKDDVNGKAKTAFAVLHGDIDAEELNVNNTPIEAVTTLADFYAALENGGEVVLGVDLTLDGTSTVITKDTTINLNGHTLSGTRAYNNVDVATSAVLTVSDAQLTITGDGKLENTTVSNVQNYAILVDNEGKLIVKDGTFIADESAVYVQHGEAIIEGGFFEAHGATSPVPNYTRTYNGVEYTCYLAAVINCSKGSYINYKDGDFSGKWANVDISGGTFVNEDPSDLAEGWNLDESHVIEGYKVMRTVQTNGDAWYTVVPE